MERQNSSTRPLIGYWQIDEQTSMLTRSDGASVQFLGRDDTRSTPGNRVWLRFMLECAEGSLQIPVEQRLVGRDENFRALWYRADFRESAPEFALWSAAERLLADALASWPDGHLAGGMPTGIGIQGGVRNGNFDPELYRLYTPSYAKIPKFGGTVAPPAKKRFWTYSPPDESRPIPNFENVGPHGSRTMWDAIEAAGRRWATLSSETSFMTIIPAEHGALRLLYVDRDHQSDRYLFRPPYANQERIWNIASRGGYILGPPKKIKTIFDVADSIFNKQCKKKEPQYAPVPSEVFQRVIESFHEALFEIEPGGVRTERMEAPPLSVRTGAPWLRAGLYSINCLTSTELSNKELRCAFLDEPEPSMVFNSPMGPAFDANHGSMTSPEGSVVMLERAEASHGIAPSKLFFRCRHAGLDWPVIIRRDDTRPDLISWSWSTQLQSRWVIDHDECLSVWRSEGHIGLPDYDTWDCLRQFLEDALLMWGDGHAAGPAPQSVATSGGWYDGTWRKSEFKRLMSRPINTDQDRGIESWKPYAPAPIWISEGATWQREEKFNSAFHYGGLPAPPPYEKHLESDEKIRLFWSGSAVKNDTRGDYMGTVHFSDYQEQSLHLRLIGNRERLDTMSFAHIEADSPLASEFARLLSRDNKHFERATLPVWRRIRDAAEGGLRDGESVTVAGSYLFDRCYPNTLRITALSAEPDDFDYRMFA